VYSISNYEPDLTVPTYSSGGYVGQRWEEPMQRYVETPGGDVSSLFIVLNTLLSDKYSREGLDSLVLRNRR
jgi:hypothetical protein